MSPRINKGSMIPVDALVPYTSAKSTTANMLEPFNPALASPRIVAAVNANMKSNFPVYTNVINREEWSDFKNNLKPLF